MNSGPGQIQLILALLLATGCGGLRENEYERKPAPEEDEPEGNLVTTAAIQNNVLNEYCIGCHKPGGQYPALTDVETAYKRSWLMSVITPGKSGESKLYTYVRDGVMPPPGNKQPPAEAVEWLKIWIDGLEEPFVRYGVRRP